MAYLCETCGLVATEADSLCNPISEEYKHKSCSVPEAKICDDSVPELKYSCTCGNMSANPQHLCHPKKIT